MLCSYDELLVGAPMYTSFDPLAVERGRIYVFFNDEVSSTSRAGLFSNHAPFDN